ncbi:phytoene desaturase [Salimicrobium jeotgali]|uniref:Phytoene desaturase n=1 Tax=Salimicrobium jeotgali TaxID=1230341 RepID=K2GMZ1_9BACI|nr:phytoene desaturase family protein [Salimicrobium jeotgali]EKE31779.1 phytoene desaturase [Salimicrobium jeotgali]MBM7696259.1 phytoene desaturase [Salimicrobium jeotgali]
MKKVSIIGAGPGGLASAMILAAEGNDVHIYEKHNRVGGRNGSWQLDGYTFDIGPTFLSMPHLVEELFQKSGRNMEDYMDMRQLTPMYELLFNGTRVPMYHQQDKMLQSITEHFPGNERGYLRFMRENKKKMDRLTPILQHKHNRMLDYLSPRVLKALPELTLGKSVYDVLSRYFDNEKLKVAFSFQAKYLGMSPWECPGAFSILSYMEHEYGVFHPIGGVNRLSKAMAEVFEEWGGRIHFGEKVTRIETENNRATALELESGERVESDEIVINADFAQAMTKLVDQDSLKKYKEENIKKKKLSCSTFMIYAGVDKVYDMPHHSILFSSDYKKNVEELTSTLEVSDEPSIYIQNPSVTDSTLAPEGHSALYILAPVPNNLSGIDWDRKKEEVEQVVLDRIEKETGYENLRDHITVKKIITPKDWERTFEVYEGATFSLGHQLSQMMYFRPHNRFEELDNTWLVGGGTHPGSGLPTILESAKITSDWIGKS